MKKLSHLQQLTWNQKQFEKIRQELSNCLNQPQLTPTEKARMIHEAIHELMSAADSESQMRLYQYVMFALTHMERFGPIDIPKADKLFQIADSVLKLQAIDPQKSAFAFTYSDLYLVRGQIYRQVGFHWLAAWNQEFSLRFQNNRASTAGPGFLNLARGHRLMRLGEVALAFEEFDNALAMGLAPTYSSRCHLAKAVALRLLKRYEEARNVCKDFLDSSECESLLQPEFAWERRCIECIQKKNFSEITGVTSFGRSHFGAAYVIESALWIFSLQSTNLHDRLPALRSFQKRYKVSLRNKLGPLLSCALTLQDCYDGSIPLLQRIESLGNTLSRIDQTIALDRELLVWLAASRWLLRIKAASMAQLTLSQYQALSRRVSQGRDSDALGIAQDLVA